MRERGFTLLEALVTLTLLGLLVAVVFPNMGRWYAGMQTRQAIAQVRGQLQQLPAVAVFTGQDLGLNDVMGAQPTVEPRYRLNLPPGWVLADAGELRFLRTGYCTPGSSFFATATQQVRVDVRTTLCEVAMTPVVLTVVGP
jgi:prepilin-type N-terminal cleavage/methylation domain-containing protein